MGFCDTLLLVLPSFLASLTAIFVLGLGGGEVIVGSLSVGLLVAFQSLLANFNQPFSDLARLGSEVQELRRPGPHRRCPQPAAGPGLCIGEVDSA